MPQALAEVLSQVRLIKEAVNGDNSRHAGRGSHVLVDIDCACEITGKSKHTLYREISHALKYSDSSRDFWNRLKSAGVHAHPKFKDGKVVGYSFKMDGTCRMSGGKISRDHTRGNLMKTLREKDQSVNERPRLTLVIPSYNEEIKENEIGLARHMDEDFSVNFGDFGINNTFPDFGSEFGSSFDAPSMEQDIRKK